MPKRRWSDTFEALDRDYSRFQVVIRSLKKGDESFPSIKSIISKVRTIISLLDLNHNGEEASFKQGRATGIFFPL